jgi:hypothetical protein
MTQSEEIPRVAPLPSDLAADAQETEAFRFVEGEKPTIDALRLAVCGWERKSEDIVECRHCFRSLGLWLYRGEQPAMESLDAVDNHLEYCPWRSAEAQDTEVAIGQHKPNEDSVPKLQRVAGWALVYQAVVRDNIKKKGSRLGTSSSASASGAVSGTNSNESLTSAQREKKMRDLLRRIKEIKKPFNVRSLLKRKDKNQIDSG